MNYQNQLLSKEKKNQFCICNTYSIYVAKYSVLDNRVIKKTKRSLSPGGRTSVIESNVMLVCKRLFHIIIKLV